jgi:xanthine dehydrogenase accessory factor
VRPSPENYPLLYAEECLAAGRSVVLATVVSCRGSGPREPGAMMAISEDGAAAGTVGGGVLEASIFEEAATGFKARRSALRSFDLSADGTTKGSMVCGGRMEILVQYIDPGEPGNALLFRRLVQGRSEGRRQSLMISIGIHENQVSTGLGLFRGNHLETGSLDSAGEKLLKARLGNGQGPVMVGRGTVRYFIQPVPVPEAVFIVGAGHVGQALADLCGPLEFRTIVIDDRDQFANHERFPAASKVLIISSYQDCFRGLNVDESSFIVIVTRGHEHDKKVLAAALQTRARYIGMIASRRKRDVIYRELAQEGVQERELARVHSPIGIDIGAKTPAEIAISIAAEMISFRSSAARNDRK